MSEVSKKDLTSYVELLPIQYSNSEKLKTFLSIFLAQVEELEVANIDLDNFSTDIDLAFGYQLDIIGKLVGVLREGRSDEEYREAIYFQISLNTGEGTPEDAIQYLSYTTKATKIGYWEHYPASVILESNGNLDDLNITSKVDNVVPAGVSVGGIIDGTPSGEVFRGCDTNIAYSNLVDGVFQEVDDSDPLARCILPDFGDPQSYFGYYGDPLSDSFGSVNSGVDGSNFISLSHENLGGVILLPPPIDTTRKYWGYFGNQFSCSFGTVLDPTIGCSFISLSEYLWIDSTKGFFADIYT